MNETVNITGIDKAELLAALHNNSRPLGLGVLHDIGRDLTVEEAAHILKQTQAFDYLLGRPLKVDLSRDEVAPWAYDRDNGGPGMLASIVDGLRES